MTNIGQRIRELPGERRGVAALEFALALPVLIILLAGGYELGRALWQHHLVAKGVRDAARYLTRVPDPSAAQYVDRATNLVIRGSFDAAAAPLLWDWQDDPSLIQIQVSKETVDNSAGTFRGPDGGTADIDIVRVTATVQYRGTGLLAFIGMAGGIQYSLAHEERHFGE